MKRSEVEKHLGEFVAVELIDGTKVAGFLAQGDQNMGNIWKNITIFASIQRELEFH